MTSFDLYGDHGGHAGPTIRPVAFNAPTRDARAPSGAGMALTVMCGLAGAGLAVAGLVSGTGILLAAFIHALATPLLTLFVVLLLEHRRETRRSRRRRHPVPPPCLDSTGRGFLV